MVFNRVFLRQKPPKPRQVAPEFRLIIDLSEVNKFLKLKTFSMDTPSEMRKHMELDLWVLASTCPTLTTTYPSALISTNSWLFK